MTSTESTSPMEDISMKLLQAVKTLHSYLDTKDLSHPSFDKDTPPVVLPDDAPLEVQSAREQIMDAALRLFRLAAGPSDYIAHARASYQEAATLQWLCKFEIFDLIPAEGTISYTELAAKANVAVSQAKSVIRMAMTSGLFEEPVLQQVSHSATSLYIRNSDPTRTWAAWLCDVAIPTATRMVDAQKKWPESLSRAHTAYSFANDTELPFFQHLAQVPGRKAQFEGLMKAVSSLQKLDLKHTIAGFDWASLGEATVVDVGGSTGHISIALAREFPSLRFIVEDLPEVISDAQSHLDSLPDSTTIGPQITYLPHNFLTPQPIIGAAVYFLRMILHDWPTVHAIEILSQLARAMEKHSRIIVMDALSPDPGSVPLARERLVRVQDLTMLQNFNGGERALEDWRELFEQVEGGLEIKAIRQPAGSHMVFIELALKDEKREEEM
ncbi:S-adenosyl-L-methionine-dependent methyltransferase [Aspergillus pseudoustus]|uniref:S-adenosyl-L-methionine-dependent methyltransferase n=1 Tax=Aspergillus pseudoustus TaxID=1810923 RepID=A0ABR4KGW6_9EURO